MKTTLFDLFVQFSTTWENRNRMWRFLKVVKMTVQLMQYCEEGDVTAVS